MIRRILRRGNLRALRVRMVVPGRARRRSEEPVTHPTVSHAEVAFEARQDSDGHPIIGLVLTRSGKPAAGDRMFTFHLAPNLTSEDAHVLVDALNRCVTHLGMAALSADETNGRGDV